jgi:hypothetical protein
VSGPSECEQLLADQLSEANGRWVVVVSEDERAESGEFYGDGRIRRSQREPEKAVPWNVSDIIDPVEFKLIRIYSYLARDPSHLVVEAAKIVQVNTDRRHDAKEALRLAPHPGSIASGSESLSQQHTTGPLA